jgi:hypothetical protein
MSASGRAIEARYAQRIGVVERDDKLLELFDALSRVVK